MQSVSSEEAVPVFELSRGSTVSSDNGVYPLRASDGDEHISQDDSLEGSVSAAYEHVFVEPQVIQLASWFGFLNYKSRLSHVTNRAYKMSQKYFLLTAS